MKGIIRTVAGLYRNGIGRDRSFPHRKSIDVGVFKVNSMQFAISDRGGWHARHFQQIN